MTIADLVLPPESHRLDSEPLSDHVYRVLRDAICDGLFDDHTHLVQNQLAEQLRVSRTPVRDALLRLAQEGLVRAVGARGYIVDPLTERELLDVYEVRLLLEVEAALLSLPLLSDADVLKLEALNLQVREAGVSIADRFERNQTFHLALVDRCPNRLIVKILADIWRLPISRRIYRRQELDHAYVKGPDDHQGILDAVRARDPEALRTVLSEHLRAARDEASRFLAGETVASA